MNKKILFAISSIKKDGPNRVLENMIFGIDKSKYDIYVLSFMNSNDEESIKILKNFGVKVIELDLRRKIDIIFKGVNMLNHIIKEYDISIVHSHGILPDICNSKSVSKYKVTTLHCNLYEDYVYLYGKLRGNCYINLHLHYLKKMDKCVCCSKSIYDVMCRKLSNCTYIRNSIYRGNDIVDYEKKRSFIREKYNICENDIVFIYIGVLSKRKNVLKMVENFNKSLKKNQYLLILGDGSLKDDILKLKVNKNIILCGFQKNVEDYLCASDIYCSFSLSEGFSISILEALECNNLLLLNNIPSHKEIFSITDKMYIGEYFDLQDFENKKNIVIDYLNNKCVKSKDFVSKYLNCNKMMERYSDIYKEED